MLYDYLPIVILLTVSLILAGLVVGLGHLFGPRRPTKVKQEPYESGMIPIGPAVRRIPVKFYLVAVLFILFDIEVVFFLPWAVVFNSFVTQGLGLFIFVEMLVFIAILLVGYIYAWKKGALEWE
ncbi:MAG: NADH-quinone oxidoreductase subunit A [Chloroflexi bacterium]|nr:NADH-quinone oxidoreductase subunit A [Chloroflexota bacterium]MBI3762128.1 NADH-quinone oxidoreductase subunit A [Chloroflexota bacterium]